MSELPSPTQLGSWGSKEDSMSPALQLGACSCPQPTLDVYIYSIPHKALSPGEIQEIKEAALLSPQGA